MGKEDEKMTRISWTRLKSAQVMVGLCAAILCPPFTWSAEENESSPRVVWLKEFSGKDVPSSRKRQEGLVKRGEWTGKVPVLEDKATVSKGGTLELRLQVILSERFTWQSSVEDEKRGQLTSLESYRDANGSTAGKGRPGLGRAQFKVFRFKATASGNVRLEFDYSSLRKTDTKPVPRYVYRVLLKVVAPTDS
jgi:hypothetical protein